MRNFSLAVLLLLSVLFSSLGYGTDEYDGIDRIVAIGDLHGDYQQYLTLLRSNKLIDRKNKWQGGGTHLVQLGDIVDRGPDSLKIIRHLMKLEKQAKRAGGQVHVLIGNHEAMNIQGVLDYVHTGEYSALVDKKSKRLREKYINAVFNYRVKVEPELLEDEDALRAELDALYPLGYVEHRQLWEPGQEVARWVAGHDTVLQLDDTIFLHGGLNPHTELLPLNKINEGVRTELSQRFSGDGLANSPDGPIWYRGLARNEAEQELEPLIAMLDHYGASRIVIAHTPTRGAIVTRFEGRVVMIDVGLSAHYGGSMANLLIENGVPVAVHRGQPVPLPESEKELDAYFESVVALEPEGSKLVKYVAARKLPHAKAEIRVLESGMP